MKYNISPEKTIEDNRPYDSRKHYYWIQPFCNGKITVLYIGGKGISPGKTIDPTIQASTIAGYSHSVIETSHYIFYTSEKQI